MKYKIKRTNKFTKQYAKMLKQKEFKEDEFIKVLGLLANDEVLPPKYKNHLLTPKSKRYMGMSYTTRYIIRISKTQQRIDFTFVRHWYTFKSI